jgi:hypothetical protein
MRKDPIEAVVSGLFAADQAAGLGSIDRYQNDAHYRGTIDRTARVAVEALKIEPAEPASATPLYRIRGLEE